MRNQPHCLRKATINRIPTSGSVELCEKIPISNINEGDRSYGMPRIQRSTNGRNGTEYKDVVVEIRKLVKCLLVSFSSFSGASCIRSWLCSLAGWAVGSRLADARVWSFSPVHWR